jgi:hypothetical protein
MDAVDQGRIRLVGLAIIGLTLVAIALLFAGQGPIVAAGALVGLVLGLVAGLLGLLWMSRGGGNAISFRTVIPGEMPAPDSPLMEHMRESAEVAGTDLGPVEFVRSIVQTANAAGVTLMLIAMEHRAAGATLTFEGRGSIGTHVPTGMPIVRVTDDHGTIYQSASQGGSGSTADMRYETTILPAPPPSARVLTVSVEGFMEFDPWSPKSIEGPWVFEVALD